jgi:hypothetical protein
MDFLPLPNRVYNYRSAESALEILKEQTIYLSTASSFNDPFDSKMSMDFESMADDDQLQRKFAEKFLVEEIVSAEERKAAVERIIAEGRIRDKEILRSMEEGRVKKIEEVFRVFCVSVIPDNLLMWAHYANCHSGVCIGFNPQGLIEAIGPTWVGPVRYSLECPQCSILEHPETLLEILLFNKSIDWLYEKEIRYVKSWDEGECKIRIPLTSINEIYIGCMASESTHHQITEIVREKYPHVKVAKYCKDRSMFALKATEL